MLKFKGQEYPVSFFRIMLADNVADKLEYIRKYLDLPNNIEAFTLAINLTYNSLREKQLEIKKATSDKEAK